MSDHDLAGLIGLWVLGGVLAAGIGLHQNIEHNWRAEECVVVAVLGALVGPLVLAGSVGALVVFLSVVFVRGMGMLRKRVPRRSEPIPVAKVHR